MPQRLVGDLVIDFVKDSLDVFRDFPNGFVLDNIGKVKTQLSGSLDLGPSADLTPVLEFSRCHGVFDNG